MIRPPPSTTPFPYTTLFRSQLQATGRCHKRISWLHDRAYVGHHDTARDLGLIAAGALCVLIGKPLARRVRSEEHTSELQSQSNLVCRLLLEKKKPTGPTAAE